VRVRVHGHRDLRMAKDVHHYPWGDSLNQKERGARVSQVMKPPLRQAGVLGPVAKDPSKAIEAKAAASGERAFERAVVRGEDKIGGERAIGDFTEAPTEDRHRAWCPETRNIR
jgi:hypothetical protein